MPCAQRVSELGCKPGFARSEKHGHYSRPGLPKIQGASQALAGLVRTLTSAPPTDFNSSFWALEFVLLPRSRWCWCHSPPSGGIHPSHARQRLSFAFRKFEIWTLKFLSLFFCLFLSKAHIGGRKKKKTVAWRSVFLLWGFAPYLPWGGVEGTVQFSTDGKQQWLRTMA